MTNPTLTGQDEARRAALADSLQVTFECQGKNLAADIGTLVIANLPTILAALRAPSLDRGAEEMRERAVKTCEAVALGMARIGPLGSAGANACAKAIRALPVPADLNEGGGK